MCCNYNCPMLHLFRQEFPGGPPPFGGPGGQGGHGGSPNSGPPNSPPPSLTPQKSQSQMHTQGFGATPFAVDPGAIRPCVFRYVYIWPRHGRGFWAWLTFVGRRSVSGWRWNGRRWVYFGMDLRQIDSFVCR